MSGPAAGASAWVEIHLDRLARNLSLLGELAGAAPLWPVVKSNAYGHGAVGVARAIVELGHDTLCVARVPEAMELQAAGVEARFVLLSGAFPEEAEIIAAHGFEPVVCKHETVEALARAAERIGCRVAVHIKVDTGMGRAGIRPDQVPELLECCRAAPGLTVRGLMSHFPRADEGDLGYSLEQLERFRAVVKGCEGKGIVFVHMANSAGLFDVPGCVFDAVRPGISIYGLRPSPRVTNPRTSELRPVLEWKARITFLKEVPPGTGISYGHSYQTTRPSRIATVPLGYGDGVSRLLSNRLEVLVGGIRCPQVGNITMDQFMVDVSALGSRVQVGDEVVLIGEEGGDELTADALAATLGTINYEIVTAISPRLRRVFFGSG